MSMIGKSLSHYQITSLIGKGGMGEVYQATDTKLGRDVAIKVLPEEFARDADRVARFQREAKLLASLNHPNIAAIHGLEEADNIHFLVLELVEGQTLAERIQTGPMDVEEALKLGLQIAEALEAAHEKSVIHRDLKPANIKVTPEGKVKVLDFGLAKAFAGDTENINLSNSPTLSDAATQQGVILGTAAYMSPEQARGNPVNKRADIWAFGVVLYEMLTGKTAFSGRDVTDTLAAVIRSEPDWSSLPANLHWRLKELLERCLEKEAKDRYGSISDARVDIKKVLADPSGVFSQPSILTKPKKKLRVSIPWVAAITIISIIIAGVIVWILKPTPTPEPRKVVHFTHVIPEDHQFTFLYIPLLAVSPDGRQFLYSTTKGFYIRSIDQLKAILIPGTEEARTPFFSPDGKSIGYWSVADEQLKKISVRGGVPVPLCDSTVVYGAIWYPDNTILYSEIKKGIMRVSSDGGIPELLAEGTLGYPQLLPDGKTLTFTDYSKGTIVLQSLESGERRVLFAGESGWYLPSGHIVYMHSGGHIFAVPFDINTLEVTGGHYPIVEGVMQWPIPDSGTLIYIPRPTNIEETVATPGRTLVWVDRDGKETSLSVNPKGYDYIRISPDGTKVALTVRTGNNSEIWIRDIARETDMKLTLDEVSEVVPLWTPDSEHIVSFSGSGDLLYKAADGAGKVESLDSDPDRALIPFSWADNGKILVLQEFTVNPISFDIGMLSMEGDRERKGLLQDKHFEIYPQISPDGKWIAYQSNESGQSEIYVRPFPDVNSDKKIVSTDGGNSPLWSPDGRELFYRNGDATMVIPVETDPTFNPGNPEILFQGNEYYVADSADLQITTTPWDIHPDGDRFLMIKEPETTTDESSKPESTSESSQRINVIVNWFEELRQKAPVD